MELRHLRYFAEVAESKSFSGAARKLHVSQSSISEQIRDLEEEIGVALVVRGARENSLTDHGNVFLAEVKNILKLVNHAVEEAQRSVRGEIGTLSIGFMAWSTSPFFPQIIRLFRQRFPAVRLSLSEMTPVQQMKAMQARQIDIGFTRPLETPPGTEFCFETIYNDPIVVVLPKSHRLAPGPVAVADLARENFLLYPREAAPSLFDTIIGLCKNAGFSPRIVNNPVFPQTMLTLIEAGEGIALVPSNVRHLRPRGLAFCRLEPDSAVAPLAMAWRDGNKGTVLQAFLDLVRERKPLIVRAMVK